MQEQSGKYKGAELRKFKRLITDQLDVTRDQLQTLKADKSKQKQHIAAANLDFNENSKHFQQQAKTNRHIRRLQRKSRALQAALHRIENGTYGICERSGNLIRAKRLEAMPTARFEIAHHRR